MKRCQEALAHARSWRVLYVDNHPASKDEHDALIVCPAFIREKVTTTDLRTSETREIEELAVNGELYYWDARGGRGWQRFPGSYPDRFSYLKERCAKGPLNGGDFIGLPLSDFLAQAEIKRGELRTIGDSVCRDYLMAYPTPTQIRTAFDATLCIDEKHHLPLEVRRPRIDSAQALTVTFSQWNQATEPELPPDLLKAQN